MSIIVFPMAGNSSRFKNGGYKLQKYELPIWEYNLFVASVLSFKNYFDTDHFIFITRSDHNNSEFINKSLSNLKINSFQVVKLDFETSGQAHTVYEGLKKLHLNKFDQQLYIFNIDTIRPNFKKPKNLKNFLEVTNLIGENWSFAKIDKNNNVTQTTEKKRISDFCSTGLYGFESSKIFINFFQDYSNKYKRESYVAPMYNLLIKRNIIVKINEINQDEVFFAGTPSEYEFLKNKKNPFK